MTPPIHLPFSPKRVLVIESTGKTRLEEEMPSRPCGISCGAFPVVILLRTMDQARHAQNNLNSWLPRMVRTFRGQEFVEQVGNWEELVRLSQAVSEMSEGYKGFYVDVRSGDRSAVYCSSREAFLSMSEVQQQSQRAFVYDTFRGAFLSALMRPGGPPAHCIYDFNPTIDPPRQMEIGKAILGGLRPGAGHPITAPPPRRPAASSASQDPELAVLLHAQEISYGWALYYLHAHGFGAEAGWIQDRFDLGSGQDEFVADMTRRFGEAKFSEYHYIYSLFRDL
ncbi:hypothetical protein V5O48_008619 [Marasmius crinis-equi]|uniref:Uncharacterized protein n=1 Tax=Marasmius crinis-equi TaxID=585013 RepID=A0ABR3FDW7_9AGAR